MLIMTSMRYMSEIVLLGVELDELTSLIKHISKFPQFKLYISKSLISLQSTFGTGLELGSLSLRLPN